MKVQWQSLNPSNGLNLFATHSITALHEMRNVWMIKEAMLTVDLEAVHDDGRLIVHAVEQQRQDVGERRRGRPAEELAGKEGHERKDHTI